MIGACLTGFGDCDGQAADGCENDLTAVPNCGGCGNSCDDDSLCTNDICVSRTCRNVDRKRCANPDPSNVNPTDPTRCGPNGCGACNFATSFPGCDNPDSDGDGLPDDYESGEGFNPQDPNDARADADADGLSNVDEFNAGTDPRTDLALIKVSGRTDFPFAKLSDSKPRIGDWVLAVGNPFGLGGTVTAGIVSASGRDIGNGPYDDFIQIDAPVNKGNSGGPAFDTNGEVMGVNTAIYSPSGGSVGIAFSIPASTVKNVIAQLRDKGSVSRGWIGVQIQPVTSDIADSLGMKKAEGALVAEPQANGPAAKAGIQSGDVITAVNGEPVRDAKELARTIGGLAPGAAVKLNVLQKGQDKVINLTLGQLPNTIEAKADTDKEDKGGLTKGTGVPKLGLTVAPANSVAGAGKEGVVVTEVDPKSAAAERGFKEGDVILEVAGKGVTSAGDVRDAIDAARTDNKNSVLMRVKSGGSSRFVAVPLAKG